MMTPHLYFDAGAPPADYESAHRVGMDADCPTTSTHSVNFKAFQVTFFTSTSIGRIWLWRQWARSCECL